MMSQTCGRLGGPPLRKTNGADPAESKCAEPEWEEKRCFTTR